jgi:hypothetical protein
VSAYEDLCVEHLAAKDDRIAELEAEIDRLRNLLSTDPKVTKFHYTPEDGVEVEVEHWAVRLLAASLAETFDKAGGVSFVTTTITGHPKGPIEVTVAPTWGERKTTAQVLAELRAENEGLRQALRPFADYAWVMVGLEDDAVEVECSGSKTSRLTAGDFRRAEAVLGADDGAR